MQRSLIIATCLIASGWIADGANCCRAQSPFIASEFSPRPAEDDEFLPVNATLTTPEQSARSNLPPKPAPGRFTLDLRLRDDLRDLGPTLWQDTHELGHWENAAVLGVSLAAAIGLRQDVDGDVREWTADHPLRWGDASQVLGAFGEATYQIPALLALWGWSLAKENVPLHDFMMTTVSAYTINGLAVLAVKGIANTSRPDSDWNGGRWGFPSFHAASSFTLAAVVDEYYGHEWGLPSYVLAGLIGWSRIDERDHDLSDVVFGAAMGWVIGRSVARSHRSGDGRVLILPWSHPTEPATGVAVHFQF